MNYSTNEHIKQLIGLSFEHTKKILKSYESLTGIESIDVGTADKELVFEIDKIKLYRYDNTNRSKGLTPLVIIYSLINRPYMLDLQPDRSMIRSLLNEGLDVYLIDTGHITEADRFNTLDDYINDYFNGCIDHVIETTPHKNVTLVGICQGGMMALIYSAIYPDKVGYLIPVVTPVDFSVREAVIYSLARYVDADKLINTMGIIPGEMLNESFRIMKPFGKVFKYLSSLDLFADPYKMQNFLRMEKWIFDTPALPGECNRQFIIDIYQKNKLVEGGLIVGDKEVDLKKITMPVLNIYAAYDHIVPASSTIIMDKLIGSKDYTAHKLVTGHIGVFVGSKSQNELAPAIGDWLKSKSKKKRKKKTVQSRKRK